MAILLLVIPLLLQSLFLYRQEYEQKLQDVKADLKLLANERAHFIEETIQMNWDLLSQYGEFFENSSTPKNETFPGGPILNRSVKQYIERIPLPPGASGQFVAISKSRDALLAAMAESSSSALVIAIPFSVIARDMPRAYPIRIAIVSSLGQLLWENRERQSADLIETEDPIANTGISVRLTVEKSQIKELHIQSYYLRFVTLVFFVGIIGGSAVFFFTRRIAKPLRSLCRTMERVAEGGAHVRYTPDWMGFEINALGLQFNETLDGLLRHAGEAEKERLHRERLAKELSIGHEIQANLLPTRVPGLPGVDIATGYFASKEVNGDFYDLFQLPSGKLLIAICDTAGKGISACLFALGLRSILRAFGSMEIDLSELVKRANDLYTIDAHEASMFSTLWIGIYDPKTTTLRYCSQGHPPALLVRGVQIEELWTQGIALGAQRMDVIPTQETLLIKGDLLVLYTDGIIEAHDPDNHLFGKERLYELLMRKQKTSSQQIADRIIEEVQLFAHGSPQHDDMTLLVMRIEN